jgi:hypothetical protein
VLHDLPGFHEDVGSCRTIDDLPAAARDYLDFIEAGIGVPVKLVGVGPGHDQVVWMDRDASRFRPTADKGRGSLKRLAARAAHPLEARADRR